MEFPRTPRRLRTTTSQSDSSQFPRTPLRRISTLQSSDGYPRTPLRRDGSSSSSTNYHSQTPRTPSTRRRRQPTETKSQPKSSSNALPRRLVEFLNENYKNSDDLSKTTSLASQINGECMDGEKRLNGLQGKLSLACSNWVSRSEDFHRIVAQNSLSPQSQGEDLVRMVRVELPMLAKEIQQIETIQSFAEKALKLEAMVGNLEDTAFSIIKQTSTTKSFSAHNRSPNLHDMQFKQEKLMNCINSMKEIEQELSQICTNRPKWANLIKAVDSRLENILSILRPQSLSDYRALLSALNWPPPLLTSQSQPNSDQSEAIPNPLLLMDSFKSKIYSQSFLGLCALQYIQYIREARLGGNLQNYPSFENGLWAVDELVRPIASRMEYHFAKWSDKFEFIFSLVYKVSKDFMDGVDDVLQPLIDKAKLRGLSAKEAWVSSMVKVVSGYLEKQVFGTLVGKFYENKDGNLEVFSSWIELIDLMITFDKRMLVLSSNGVQNIYSVLNLNESLAKSLSIFSIFEENPNWLKIWAEIDLNIAQEKIEPELENEKNWLFDFKIQNKNGEELSNNFLLSTREEYKAPLIVDFVMKIASTMIEKGRSLPIKKSKFEFIKNSASLFLNHFFIILLERAKDLELMTSTIDETAMIQISNSINSARYFETLISEWDEDVTFLDLGSSIEENEKRSFFADEISFLVKLETDCLDEIMSAILLEFESFSFDYMQNIEQWEDEDEEEEEEEMNAKKNFSEEDLQDGIISQGLIEALEILRDRIVKLQNCLNPKDFFDLWRSVAEGLDYFIFSSITWRDVRFSNRGIYQFRVDMRAILTIFKPFCAKPEAFFPFVSECLRLLSLSREEKDLFLKELVKNERRLKDWLKQKGIYHVSGGQAKMILQDI